MKAIVWPGYATAGHTCMSTKEMCAGTKPGIGKLEKGAAEGYVGRYVGMQ
jgi:hypothetical protein